MGYFKVLVSCGHVGAAKEITVSRFFVADNIIEAFECGNRMPGAKRKHTHTAVLMVKPISEKEYKAGKCTEQSCNYTAAGNKR